MDSRQARSDAGFSLLEVMVSMVIMLIVLGGTFTAMTSAMRAEELARGITTLNGHLRSSMDVLVRDFLQIGQGLQVGRVISVPNGPGAQPIVRPGPAAVGACAGVNNFPVDPTISAVTVGPDLGPPINGQCTDVITSLAIDGAFENVNVSAMAVDGQSISIHPNVDISDAPDAFGDNLRVGDLLELRRAGTSDTATVYITNVAGQTVTFAPGDPLGLNQFDVALAMQGTTNQIRTGTDPAAPVVLAGVTQQGPWTAYRVRMISYYVDTLTNPASPRLVRQINANPPNAVAFELEAFRLTYDIADGTVNPSAVRMDATDLGAAGACAPFPCSANQIRKANVALAIRSEKRSKENGYHHNTLFTQVALRSLSFVDRFN